MTEAVRLVIWDLDETFWRGTITEGGIQEYLQANHDLVIELAKRGIMSSICSKNDKESTLKVLQQKNILDYFIFPSIAWEPKGQRIASLIEAVQLRPATVMFIDDNPNNRAEAAAIVPDLQVADETFITKILDDPRFKGKNDEKLTRLAQYKLLETRKRDEQQASGNNEEFLRGCDVRVYVEYDVLPHMDRAIELINRTNQLNFTKVRLPEDIDEARKQVREAIEDHFRQCGLVRVVDKYGDYGFVGFFMLRSGALDVSNGKLTQYLEHYCFSCRTLGMLVEHWFYDRLQRPQIKVVGEVLTDLSKPRTIDWIRTVDSLEDDRPSLTKVAPEIRIHGGCEANSVAHYLGSYSDKVVVTGNFHAGTNFFRVNGSSLLLSAADRSGPEFEKEAAALGVPHPMLVTDYFRNSPRGTAFVFGGQMDSGAYRYRHKVHGWEIFIEPHGLSGLNLATASIDEINHQIENLEFSEEAKKEIASVAKHVHENYESITFRSEEVLPGYMHEIFARIPEDSKLVIVLDHERVRDMDGSVRDATWMKAYPPLIRSIAEPFPFVGVVSFGDHVQSDDEIHVGGNHYDRMVYYRLAEAIVSKLRSLQPKNCNLTAPGSEDTGFGLSRRPELGRAVAEARDPVEAA